MPRTHADTRSIRAVLSAPYPLPIIITRSTSQPANHPSDQVDNGGPSRSTSSSFHEHSLTPPSRPVESAAQHGFPSWIDAWSQPSPAYPPVPYTRRAASQPPSAGLGKVDSGDKTKGDGDIEEVAPLWSSLQSDGLHTLDNGDAFFASFFGVPNDDKRESIDRPLTAPADLPRAESGVEAYQTLTDQADHVNNDLTSTHPEISWDFGGISVPANPLPHDHGSSLYPFAEEIIVPSILLPGLTTANGRPLMPIAPSEDVGLEMIQSFAATSIAGDEDDRSVTPTRANPHPRTPKASRQGRLGLSHQAVAKIPMYDIPTPSSRAGWEQDSDDGEADEEVSRAGRHHSPPSAQLVTPESHHRPGFFGATNIAPFTYFPKSKSSRRRRPSQGSVANLNEFDSDATSTVTVVRVPRGKLSKVKTRQHVEDKKRERTPTRRETDGQRSLLSPPSSNRPEAFTHPRQEKPTHDSLPSPAPFPRLINQPVDHVKSSPSRSMPPPPLPLKPRLPPKTIFNSQWHVPPPRAETEPKAWTPQPMSIDPRSGDARYTSSWPHPLPPREAGPGHSTGPPGTLDVLTLAGSLLSDPYFQQLAREAHQRQTSAGAGAGPSSLQPWPDAGPSGSSRPDRYNSPQRHPSVPVKACHDFLLQRRIHTARRKRQRKRELEETMEGMPLRTIKELQAQVEKMIKEKFGVIRQLAGDTMAGEYEESMDEDETSGEEENQVGEKPIQHTYHSFPSHLRFESPSRSQHPIHLTYQPMPPIHSQPQSQPGQSKYFQPPTTQYVQYPSQQRVYLPDRQLQEQQSQLSPERRQQRAWTTAPPQPPVRSGPMQMSQPPAFPPQIRNDGSPSRYPGPSMVNRQSQQAKTTQAPMMRTIDPHKIQNWSSHVAAAVAHSSERKASGEELNKPPRKRRRSLSHDTFPAPQVDYRDDVRAGSVVPADAPPPGWKGKGKLLDPVEIGGTWEKRSRQE
ncbi:hypothetical protein TREMEDRAFT_63615 [Tremella mesenterica DSM 1558]|uniref:uncharacterized protein n=1 Tax=Tremella mesenterica (strain ATCC 24925 / CBS 8224 / DSM 1558 / NBRC 9311 / NRRL Y-6157 / RJB 2259-6 / UBC 559-6) TaxID=578456 RepID=UPI0003F49CAC|nr:uncharacterized protein TREMEDRAFT_63615 [Tremella mesenterica DSM 1558]EIW68446.1 hypothetical protein TREMEDRAFT_63615 [Tremella mesenterica DSM 1558]